MLEAVLLYEVNFPWLLADCSNLQLPWKRGKPDSSCCVVSSQHLVDVEEVTFGICVVLPALSPWLSRS